MSDRSRLLIVNISIAAALIWCYFSGYPLIAIVLSGGCLFLLANVLMYFKRRRR